MKSYYVKVVVTCLLIMLLMGIGVSFALVMNYEYNLHVKHIKVTEVKEGEVSKYTSNEPPGWWPIVLFFGIICCVVLLIGCIAVCGEIWEW
jgi:hypothetical protein